MSKYAFGVDIGGTTVKLGLFDKEGCVLDKWEIPTVKDNHGASILPDVAASIKAVMAEKGIDAVGRPMHGAHYRSDFTPTAAGDRG